jgi:hypothetical protein
MCACVAARERTSFVERCVIQRRGQSHRESAADDALPPACLGARCEPAIWRKPAMRARGAGVMLYCVPRNAPAA